MNTNLKPFAIATLVGLTLVGFFTVMADDAIQGNLHHDARVEMGDMHLELPPYVEGHMYVSGFGTWHRIDPMQAGYHGTALIRAIQRRTSKQAYACTLIK